MVAFNFIVHDNDQVILVIEITVFMVALCMIMIKVV